MIARRPRAIFLHVPKTAGSTIRDVISRAYPPEERFEIESYDVSGSLKTFLDMPPSRTDGVRMIYGHMPFGMHASIPHDWTYVTLVREPVDRIISHYHYVIRTPQLPQYREVIETRMTLKDYVRKGPGADFFNNGQTRYLGATNFPDEGPATPAFLHRAKMNLMRHFAVVGTTERFDESLLLMKNSLDWEWPLYTSQKVSPVKRTSADLNSDERQMVLERNNLDVELYEFVQDLIEDQLSRQEPTFWSELEEFRQKQAAMPSGPS